MRKEIRISGFGGQGVSLAGMILGKALTIYQDMEAVMTQAYGPEARGGASSANVVLSDLPIAFPFVQSADVLVALSQEAYTKFRPEARPEAQVLIDQELVTSLENDVVSDPPPFGPKITARPALAVGNTSLGDAPGREGFAGQSGAGGLLVHGGRCAGTHGGAGPRSGRKVAG